MGSKYHEGTGSKANGKQNGHGETGGSPRRKRRRLQLIAFRDKAERDKLDIMLHWVLKTEKVVQILLTMLLTGRKLKISEIELDHEHLPYPLMNARIGLSKPFCCMNAYKRLQVALESLSKARIPACGDCWMSVLNTEAVMREACLFWHQIQCQGMTKVDISPGNFFCGSRCKGETVN